MTVGVGPQQQALPQGTDRHRTGQRPEHVIPYLVAEMKDLRIFRQGPSVVALLVTLPGALRSHALYVRSEHTRTKGFLDVNGGFVEGARLLAVCDERKALQRTVYDQQFHSGQSHCG